MAHEALVQNASDPAQVGRARRKEFDLVRQQRDDMRHVLASEQGRRVLWRLLQAARVYGSVYHENPIAMAHSAGRQDAGHQLTGWIDEADDTALLRMGQEARAASKRESVANLASRTARASDDRERL